MAALEEFLRTGRLGPLILGLSPNEIMAELGDPDAVSRKSNPLLLKYGCVQLTFWKPKEAKQSLREITIDFEHVLEALPPPLEFSDWRITDPPTERRFRDFLYRIEYLPIHRSEGVTWRELVFPSGVTARLKDEMLVSIRLVERENKSSTPITLTDEREPTPEQIFQMFEEAEIASKAGAPRAALLIAWAGLEAILRRVAAHSGLRSRVGTQPVVLLRELVTEGRITGTDLVVIEDLRQKRMSAAHGLSPVTIPTNIVKLIKDISNHLLSSTVDLTDPQPALGAD
jgi:hypothetical protein